jgi:predicted aldo/keto reductase-like oxidoreductase
MQYRTLGKTGLQVSVVGFGGIPIQRIEGTQVRPLMEKLVEKGVNYIDTARGYTVSEEYLGEALEGLRDRFILATKSMARSYEAMANDIETSLRNLRTDYIDIYQLHNIKTEADFALAFSDEGAVAAIRDAIRDGKVGHLGATAHSVESFEKLLTYPEIETIMFPYNIVESQGEAMMARAAEQNVGFIAMKPLAGGNIADGTLAMRYILQNPHCTLAIPGMATLEEIEQNTAAAAITGPLTPDEQAAVNAVRAELSGNFCRRCGYCAPCTVGIDIPSMFLFEGYLKHYDLADWAKTRYAASKATASACIGCGKCEERCPYNLPIREKLRQVAALFEPNSTAQ